MWSFKFHEKKHFKKFLLFIIIYLLFVDMWVNTVPFWIVSVCEYCVQKVVSFINSASTPFNWQKWQSRPEHFCIVHWNVNSLEIEFCYIISILLTRQLTNKSAKKPLQMAPQKKTFKSKSTICWIKNKF